MNIRAVAGLLVVANAVSLSCGQSPDRTPSETSQQAPSAADLVPTQNPTNSRELVMMRSFHDQTVWRDERLAQDYEGAIVRLWDLLIHRADKYDVLRKIPLRSLIVGTEAEVRELDWGIQRTTYGGAGRTISADDWRSALSQLEQQGYELVETEWHHSEFQPAGVGPAHSVVAMLMHFLNRRTNSRYIVRGNLKVTWSEQKHGEPPIYLPETVDATDVYILERTGEPAFAEQRVEEFLTDPRGQQFPTTIHPVMLHDLNGDHLPEVVVGGFNTVYWNRGNWEFEKAQLCAHPTRHVNAAIFADFTGDGVIDYLCGRKSGFMQLYEGQPLGVFPSPPRQLSFTKEQLMLPIAITAGDIDGDGDLDVFVGQQKPGYQTGEIPTPYFDANDGFPSYLLLNDGHGNFEDVTARRGLGEKNRRRNFSSSLVDLDDDGDLDLLMTSDFSGNDLFLNDGQGSFRDATSSLQPRSYAYGMSHTLGDYNLDGRLDFMTIGMSSTTARRLDKLQLGRPDFPEYNEARKHMGYGNRMYLRGDRGFEQPPFNNSVARTGWSWGSTTLDFDRDGDQDVYIVNGQTSGKTTRDYCTRFWCHDLYYRADDRPDAAIKEFFAGLAPLFSGNSISWNGYEHNALLMNLDGLEFVSIGFLMNCASEFDSRMAVSGDIDQDGKVDLIFEHSDVRNNKLNLIFLRNQWQDAHHWIGVHLISDQGNLSPIGSKVTLELADGRVLLQHNVSGHSVWAQHPNSVHFGLGQSAAVKQISVRWPNGTVSSLDNPPVDQYHVVQPPNP